MKRIISVLLIMILTLSLSLPVSADELSNIPARSVSGEKLFQYMQGDDGKLLTLRKNYGYMTFIGDFKSDALSLYLLEMTDKLINTGATPDKEKYMETLVNIIATYDLDRADDVAKQSNMDNLKTLKDYAMDCTEMGKNAVSVMVGSNPAASELETTLSTAVDGLGVLIDNTDNWISALSNLETIVKDYSEHDEFLKLIEEESEGELKAAAQTMRKGMKEAMEIKLETYQDVSDKNYKNYEEFFFSDVFFDSVKQMPEYEADEALKYFIDAGDNIVSKVDTLGSAWDLGKMIGTLVGDAVVGGENLINRVLEMMAIYDISEILQGKIIETGTEFLNNLGKDNEESLVETYIALSNYLIGCRIRGEYCLYSVVAEDAGLLSWFNKSSAEEAKEWYDSKTEKIIAIQNNLLQVITIKEIEELSDYIDDFDRMYMEVGGNLSSETGDHEKWVLGEGIQYGNYMGSTSVDGISLLSEQYSLFNIHVGQNSDEAKSQLLESGWEVDTSSESYERYKKENYNLQYDIEEKHISAVSFWSDMSQKEPLKEETNINEDGRERAIELARQKFGNNFSYFCTSDFTYQGKEYYAVDVKTEVDGHFTRVTQVLVAKDGSYVGEGQYYNNGTSEQIEFYE